MEEKQKPSLIERRLYARILQIMEDKKPYLDPQLICASWPTSLARPYPAILYLEQSDGYELQSLAGYLSGRVPHTGIFQVPHTRAAGVIQTAGFTSRTSFYRQFKEVTGNTPIEYFANLYYNNVNDSTK